MTPTYEQSTLLTCEVIERVLQHPHSLVKTLHSRACGHMVVTHLGGPISSV
jgi:hypothetical protein